MDQYLAIAETVLKAARKPLSAREILRQAYIDHVVPHQLYGRTQHKTLGARLSEDILVRRERSAFFRTIPGRFFLREFLTDGSLPDNYRTPIVTRRRERDLYRGPVLCVTLSDLHQTTRSQTQISTEVLLGLLRVNKFHYLNDVHAQSHATAAIWSFVVVCRSTSVLTYRIGRYRDGRDPFVQKRSIGFFRAVRESDRTLFDITDHGIVSSGVRAAGIDLDLPYNALQDAEVRLRSHLDTFLIDHANDTAPNLIALIRFECPDWFEPTKRRLAINDLQWHDLRMPINHLAGC